LFLLFGASVVPWLASPAGHLQFRFLPVIGAMAILVLFQVGQEILQVGGRVLRRTTAPGLSYLAGFFATLGALGASYTMTQNVLNNQMELLFARILIEEASNRPINRIHVQRPGDNQRGYNGLPSIGDEFNRKNTDFWQDMTEVVNLAMRGCLRFTATT